MKCCIYIYAASAMLYYCWKSIRTSRHNIIVLYYFIVSGVAVEVHKSRHQWRRRRKFGGGWPRWRNGGRPTYASAGACTTWTRRSTSFGAKCPRSRTKNGCPGSKHLGWPSRTSGSWPSCCSLPRRPVEVAMLSSHPRPRRTLCRPNTTTFPTHRTLWFRPSRWEV